MLGIILSREFLEYEVRGLAMSFFPGEPMIVWYGECGGKEECGVWLKINYGPESVRMEIWREEDIPGKLCRETTVCYEERRETKGAVKRLMYDLLKDFTGKTLPWGTLTGIRPTKIATSLLEQGTPEEEIGRIMKEEYLCGPEKTALSIEIAKKEMQVLEPLDYKNGYSLYIGIPFCPTTCLYCSFTSYPIGKWAARVQEYLNALYREIDFVAESFQNRKLNTIYIGGGTPTTLTAEQLDELIGYVKGKFDLTNLLEFTVEAGRPDSVTLPKLEVLKKHGISRISINPQTMKQETLRLIGRHHTVEQVKEVYAMARSLGFDNINMDLILGLPEETMEDVRCTMEEISALRPDNLTVHSLAIKRAARLNMFWEQYAGLRMVNTEEMMELVAAYAGRIGLQPYYLYRQKNMAGNLENVGYAAEGKAGIYNILIMEEKQDIVALGAGATSKAIFGDRIERCGNVKDIDNYLERIDEMIERKRILYRVGEDRR